MALLGTAMLVKKETANADSEFEKAKTIIFAQFGNDHPMVCKFQANTVEALNQHPESQERNQKMIDICDKNLEIVRKTYGKESIFCVKPMYTAYTARLHLESIEKCEEILIEMS